MYTAEFHIDWAFIVGTLEESADSPDILNLTDRTTLYSVGSDHLYYGLVDEGGSDRSALLTTARGCVSGPYVAVNIQTTDSPRFSLLINTIWLSEQAPGGTIPLEVLIQKTIGEWQRTGNFILSKHRLFQKQFHRNIYKNIVVHTYTLDLLYRLLTDFTTVVQEEVSQNNQGSELKKVLDIGEAVALNFQNPVLTVKEMANMAGMSESKFKRLFQEAYGQSPHQYILEKKLAYARKLLQSGQYTLTQIAYKLGYNHTSGFTRLYKKKVSM
ncbi:helix-turn-helix transcriptional regulator [Fibrella aquatica]|jgi:AraC family transcriptional regulator, exoenzyme S synthesis regulatory protein ExsA|uniref:helix-turn-helix transcriptional regulator n=1 Tax=Fibrella aquatica TaxID=3242487 RepID=UPI0035222A4F